MKVALLPLALALISSPVLAADKIKIKGTINAINLEKSVFSILEKKTGHIHEIEFKPHAKIRKERKNYTDLAVLQIGDEVVYQKKPLKKIDYSTDPVSVTIKNVDIKNSQISFYNHKTRAMETLRFETEKSAAFTSLSAGDKVILELSKPEPTISAI